MSWAEFMDIVKVSCCVTMLIVAAGVWRELRHITEALEALP